MRAGKYLSAWIQGFEGRYAAYIWPDTGHCEVWCFVYSDGHGSAKSSKPLRKLGLVQVCKKRSKNPAPYQFYRLCTGKTLASGNSQYRNILRSRLLYSHFVAPIPKGYHIHHIDGDQTNDRLENLQCLSASDHRKLHKRRNNS
jgi:hypothetical protein